MVWIIEVGPTSDKKKLVLVVVFKPAAYYSIFYEKHYSSAILSVRCGSFYQGLMWVNFGLKMLDFRTIITPDLRTITNKRDHE